METTPATAPSPVRLRLVFDNRRFLRRAQRDDGLRRCWLLLRPELATVADLAAHVVARFRLRRSCPRGVVLSMDGFALPPFESICIFRDKDVIRVKQRSFKKMVGHNDVHFIQDPEIVEKRPLPIDGEILAIEYREDGCKHQEEGEGGDHQPENVSPNIENDGKSSKRKWRDGNAGTTDISKKKKLKVINPVKHIDCSEKNNVHQYEDPCGPRKLMSSSIDTEVKKSTLQIETISDLEEEQKSQRKNQTMLNCETKVADCNAQSDTTKLGSRSARRKKSKRQLRQKAKGQLEKNVQEESPIAADCPLSNNQDGLPGPSSNHYESHIALSSDKTYEEESDASEDIVPVVVRPGHIRFEPAGTVPEKAPEKDTQRDFQWSGTMSKKKGQKWGMDNSIKKNADINYHQRITGSSTEVNHHMVDCEIAENCFCVVSNQKVEDSINEPASVKTITEEGESNDKHLDFVSLHPLTQLPKEGDLIAYRLVELSSSWCPEISSYRVGKVLIYDPMSLRIILLPVREYPIIREENKPETESDMLVDTSPYKEDGSLEIDYASLLDVRLLKGYESESAFVSTPSTESSKKSRSVVGKPNSLDKNKGSINIQKPPLVPRNRKALEATPENTPHKVWEETGEAPSDKTDDVQENGWGTWRPNASTSTWSYRALSSALGPTMAILRGKNSQRGKPSNGKYAK